MDVSETQDSVDAALAPVEDTDFSDDEDKPEGAAENVVKEEFPKAESCPAPIAHSRAPPPAPPPAPCAKERDDSLNARQLRIALFALCEGLHQASRSFSTDARLIRFWLKEARKCFSQSEQELAVNAEGSEHMVAWVLSMREQQLPITESNLFHKASTLRKKGAFSDSFRISYDWAVGFMLQHHLGTQSIFREAALARRLPPSLEDTVESFREFTRQVVRVKQLPKGCVAAMDELCLFVDLRVVQDRARCSEALELTGSVPLVTVYLTVLADGAMLPSLVMTNRKLSQNCVPEFLLLQDGADSLLVEEVLDIWTNKVWMPHVSRPAQHQKSLLVLDRHREHLRDSFLTSISGSGTLPALVPGGCSFRLQPLDVCLKPVLKFFLLSRWAKLTSGDPQELRESSPQKLQANVAQILVDWLTEALTHMNKLPELWRRSFHLADLLPRDKQMDHEVDGLANQKPEEVQADLIKTLAQTLLGPDALGDGSPEALQLEDEDMTEEEEQEDSRKEAKVGPGGGDDSKVVQKDGGRGETEERLNQDKGSNVNKGGDTETEQGHVEDSKVTTEGGEDRLKDVRTAGDRTKEEDRTEGGNTPQVTEDSEEEAKAADEDGKEPSKERRETRIVIGEDVGDEWKITVKSRTDGSDVEDRLKKS